MLNNQQIFEDWLAGKISRRQCATQLQNDPLWYSRMQQAEQLQHDAALPQHDEVPHTDSSALFSRYWSRPADTRRQWWPKLSLALSCCAVLISLSPLQLQLNNGSLALSWQQNSPADTQEAVNTLLAQQQQMQQRWFEQQMQLQQQQNAAQLVMLKDYLQDEFQRSQRSDLLEVVEYLNQQREADWHYLQTHYQPVQARYQPVSDYSRNVSDNGVVKP
ncbi:hypothetical protein QE250_03795 [Chromatiaceae bacterium AAb-1]|nr:hypothetical protein [Chromatiaceae bacterium AAb-1]